jgi:hypothetical protein
MSEVLFGIVTQYDVGRAFGWVKTIYPNGSCESFFLHISKCNVEPKRYAGVRFTPGDRKEKKAREALNVTVGEIVPPFSAPVEAERLAFPGAQDKLIQAGTDALSHDGVSR